MQELAEKTTTRARFLKQLGVTLAVGVGAGALASGARADHTAGHCCPNCDKCPGGNCPAGTCPMRCNCDGIGESYCLFNECKEPVSSNCRSGPC